MRAPYFADEASALYLGDCREVLAELDAESIDAVVTDPPYGLGFMGREWDTFAPEAVAARREANARKGTTARTSERWPGKQGQSQGGGVPIRYDESPEGHRRFRAWCEEWAREAFRVSKPGAALVAFGAPRTSHHLAIAIEGAGFEIRDTLAWLFGSGFPKHASALKPAWEPIILARRSLVGSIARNVEAYGTGALNVDACRIPGPVDAYGTPAGRWPANVVLDEVAAAAVDAQAGERRVGRGELRREASIGHGGSAGSLAPGVGFGDSGGASRFFYCAKASKAEREAGLSELPALVGVNGNTWMDRRYYPDGRVVETRARRNTHPTVKPLDLMRWLVRLVTPAGGLVLDPFTGSGTTRLAALAEGRRFVGVELNEEYLAIAAARRVQAGLGIEGVI